MGVISDEELTILVTELERLTKENDELRGQVDFLMRERLDAKSLEQEARKRAAEKVLLTVREQTAQQGDEE